MAAQERTALSLRIVDEQEREIERALVTFLSADGATLAVWQQAGGRWIAEGKPPENDGWGRDAAQASVQAYACDRRARVDVERRSHGSRFGRFAPHPVPLTHVYAVHGTIRCDAEGAPEGTGLALAQLAAELAKGEPWSYASARELTRIGPAAAPALPAVVALAEGRESESLRVLAIRAVGAMGPAGRAGAPSLLRLLGDHDANLRRVSAKALESLGPETPDLVRGLASAARREPDAQTQQEMLRILGRMGQGARAAEHDLAAVLENEGEEEPVRLAAFWALGQLGTEGATAAQRRYAAEHPILWSDPAAKP